MTSPNPEWPTIPGDEPRTHPRARILTILIGLVCVALSAVAARDLWLIFAHGDRGNGWIATALRFISTAEISVGGVVVGTLIALVGLWLILSAFRRRAHTHVRLTSPTSVWTRPVDIARKSTATARREFGFSDIRSRATRSKLHVTLGADPEGQPVEPVMLEALRGELAPLDPHPKVKISIVEAKDEEF